VYDSSHGKIFAVNFVYSSVLVIDDSTNKLVANITGILGPGKSIYDAASNEILVTAYNGTTFAIDTASNRISGRVPTSGSIFLYDPDNRLLYASERDSTGSESIVALDASTFQLVGPKINLPSNPTAFGGFRFYDSFNRDIYFYSGQAFNSGGGELVAISTASNSIVAKVRVPGFNGGPVSEQPTFLIDPSNGDVYATELTDPHTGTVGLLHISANSNTIVSETFPSRMPLNDLALDAGGDKIFAAYYTSVYVLDLTSLQVSKVILGSCKFTELPP
jgi:hypothetical protein